MAKKTKHFDMRLTPSEELALKRLAIREGVSKTAYLLNYIRQQAKKKGIPL